MALSMENWLNESGALGLNDLELTDFQGTGRGVQATRRFREGERILTIPSDALWTVAHAEADALIGPLLRSAQPPLSIDDTLAIYVLFVKSRDSGYDGRRSHVAALPTSHSSSIFFTDEELDVCAGSSLYSITEELNRRIEDDYRELVMRLFAPHRHLFPYENFTVDDVGDVYILASSTIR